MTVPLPGEGGSLHQRGCKHTLNTLSSDLPAVNTERVRYAAALLPLNEAVCEH